MSLEDLTTEDMLHLRIPRSMPIQKPGKSKQNYQTPPEFLEAVKTRLNISNFAWDLASEPHNCVSPYGGFTEKTNALVQDWVTVCGVYDSHLGTYDGWLWLNPPYADIGPWVEKAAQESLKGAHIAMLIPASVGANWWRDHVVSNSYQLHLNGRLKFVGAKDYYPKDCSLLLFTPFIRSGSAVWDWKNG
jgi:phage N-6-adenine-methyltransferase